MSGSGASNLGYGNISPFNNINTKFVNVTNSHNPAIFSSNQIPGKSILNGGSKRKNISKMYKKMKRRYSKKRCHSRRKKTRCKKHKNCSRKHSQKGGYGQYLNNTTMSTSYSTGGILSPNNLALANPVPYKLLDNSAIDNFNRFNNTGFASKNS